MKFNSSVDKSYFSWVVEIEILIGVFLCEDGKRVVRERESEYRWFIWGDLFLEKGEIWVVIGVNVRLRGRVFVFLRWKKVLKMCKLMVMIY